MTRLRMHLAGHQLSAGYDADANSGADSDVAMVAAAFGGPPLPFRQRGGVDVQVDCGRARNRAAQRAEDVGAGPPGLGSYQHSSV